MNEKGLVANLLFLAESDYHRPADKMKVSEPINFLFGI